MDNNIHVALAVYDPKGTYSQHAGVTVTSIFENTKSKVTVHILHDDTLSELNKTRFLNTAKRYGQSIDLINVEEYKNKVSAEVKEKVKNKWTIGSLYRLFIPEVLSELDKIIYLDSDIIVNLDIAELWSKDVGNNCLGGVLDQIPLLKIQQNYTKLLMKYNNCELSRYINTGVLIMNLNKMREYGNLFLLAAKYFERHMYSNMWADQDALNAIFKNSIKLLDAKFNYYYYFFQNYYNEITLKVDLSELPRAILHFPGSICKPWKTFPLNKADRLYWTTLFKSEWMSSCDGGGGYANLSEEQKLNALMDNFSKLIEAERKDRHYHERIRQCLMNVVCNIPNFVIYKLSQPFKKFISWPTLKMIYKEIKARIKYKEDLRFWK